MWESGNHFFVNIYVDKTGIASTDFSDECAFDLLLSKSVKKEVREDQRISA